MNQHPPIPNINTDFLKIPCSGNCVQVPYQHIMRLEGDRNYTRIILTNRRRLLTAISLCSYEKMLPQSFFIRIHKHSIINCCHVRTFFKTHVTMHDGIEMAIARRKQNQVYRIIH